MFEDVSGFGAWQRFYFLLEGGHLLYWNSPNEMSNKVGLCNYVCKLMVDRYIGRYLALFKYQLWLISFSVWPMRSWRDFYFDSADNGSA